MKKILVIIFIVSFFGCNKNETPHPDESGLYIKFFGGAFDDNGFSVVESGDGGFYLAGSTVVPDRPDTNVLVVKINANGNKEWEKTYNMGDEYNEVARDITIGQNGELVVAGYKENGQGVYDFLLLNINMNDPADYEVILFGDPLIDEKAYNIIPSSDGAYIVYGAKASGTVSDPTSDMYLLKTNLTDTVWNRQIGVANKQDEIGTLHFTNTNQLIWCGTVQRNDGTDMRMVLADEFGNLMWDYGFDDNDGMNQYGYDLNVLTDGYILAGSRSKTIGSSAKEIYLVQTDINGTKSGSISLSEASSQEAYSMVLDGSGNFVFTGYVLSDNGDKQVYIAKIDAAGSILKSQKFGGAGDDIGKKIIKTVDGYMIIGTVFAGNNTMVGVYKVNEELELVE